MTTTPLEEVLDSVRDLLDPRLTWAPEAAKKRDRIVGALAVYDKVQEGHPSLSDLPKHPVQTVTVVPQALRPNIDFERLGLYRDLARLTRKASSANIDALVGIVERMAQIVTALRALGEPLG